MDGVIQQQPVLLAAFIVFPQLAKLVAHKVQHLAGVNCHIQIERTPLGELILILAVHLLQDGRLAMNIFIMAERQDVMLPPEIHHRESQLAQVGFAFFRCFFEVVQRIVHPAKIPLVVKAQAAVFHGGGHFFKVGGILGDEHSLRMQLVESLVHPLEEVDA